MKKLPDENLFKDGGYLQQRSRLADFLEHTDGRNGWWIGSAPTQRKTIFAELGIPPGSEPSRFIIFNRPVMVLDLLNEFEHLGLELFGSQMAEGLNLIYICGKPGSTDPNRLAQNQTQTLLQYINTNPASDSKKWVIGTCDNPSLIPELWSAIKLKQLPWIYRSFPTADLAHQALKHLNKVVPPNALHRQSKSGTLCVFALQVPKEQHTRSGIKIGPFVR